MGFLPEVGRICTNLVQHPRLEARTDGCGARGVFRVVFVKCLKPFLLKQVSSDGPPRTTNICYGDVKAASAARRKGVSAEQTEAMEARTEGPKSPLGGAGG